MVLRNPAQPQRGATGSDTPATLAAASVATPTAIATQNRTRSAHHATVYAPYASYAPYGAGRTATIGPRDIAAAAAAATVLTSDGHTGRAYPLTGPRALPPRSRSPHWVQTPQAILSGSASTGRPTR